MDLSPQKLSRWKTLNSLSFLHWRYPGPVLGKLQLVLSNFVTGQLGLGTDKGESEKLGKGNRASVTRRDVLCT